MTEKNDADSGDSDPTQRWQTLKDLFSEALEATPEEREAVLVRGAAGDAQLLAEVRGLLDASFAIAALESTGRALPFLWGSFEVRERIGSGAFGEVFRAFDPVLRREVALKLRLADVRRGFLQDARADLEFGDTLEEARRLARIRHPNVLPVLGVELHDGEIGIWTDLVQGETLEQELARTGVFSATSIARVGSDLAHALEAVHGAGIVHGDVKTSNAMQDRDGRVILMDLGASRSSLPAASDDEDRLQGSDDVGVRGTPSAMAPELFEGAVPCVATDLYALGVLIYELLTGVPPFKGPTAS
ncbi:MAG: serine/threonine protein kinase, partial [Candidatus Eisenbacteria bacterium]|nr:serine/threonine protein kinase [Candidatus Eisenbacteria bacterium]